MPDYECFMFVEDEDVLEMTKDLGDAVSKGDVIAHVHAVTKTGEKPLINRARRSGPIAGRRDPGLNRMGDCLSVIAEVVDGRPTVNM